MKSWRILTINQIFWSSSSELIKFKNEQLSGIGRQLADGTNCNFPRRGDQPEPTGGRQILMTGHFFWVKNFGLQRGRWEESARIQIQWTHFSILPPKKKVSGGREVVERRGVCSLCKPTAINRLFETHETWFSCRTRRKSSAPHSNYIEAPRTQKPRGWRMIVSVWTTIIQQTSRRTPQKQKLIVIEIHFTLITFTVPFRWNCIAFENRVPVLQKFPVLKGQITINQYQVRLIVVWTRL